MNRSLLLSAALGPFVLVLGASVASGQTCTTTRISVGPGGVDVPVQKRSPAMTPDGRFIAFVALGDGITAGDTNGVSDVFVHDRQLGTMECVSVSTSGQQGNAESDGVALSDDGRFVAFWSFADNLVGGDTNAVPDVFIRDRQTSQTALVSADSSGVQGNGYSFLPGLSADGRWVLFSSTSDNLVAGDTAGFLDLFLHDRTTGQTTRVSTGMAGIEGDEDVLDGAISADGQWIAFVSTASNLVPNDTNGQSDCFLREVATGLVQRINLGPGGIEADESAGMATISGDGRYVSFLSQATTLVPGDLSANLDIFVFDRQTGVLSLGSMSPSGLHGSQDSTEGGLSRDGRYLAFVTPSALEPGDSNLVRDIYVRDLWGTDFGRAAFSSTGQQPAADCSSPVLGASPALLAFTSEDSTLAPGDRPGTSDVFLRDCAFPLSPAYTSSCISTVIDCPCHNVGIGWGGCDNSEATGGAELAAHGTPSMAADTLRLTAWRLPAGAPGLFLQAPIGLPPTPWGDGLVCIGGSTIRLGVRFAAGGIVQLGYGLAGDPVLSVESLLPPSGGTRSYQLVYRNPDPGFCLPDTFNSSNAIQVVWAP